MKFFSKMLLLCACVALVNAAALNAHNAGLRSAWRASVGTVQGKLAGIGQGVLAGTLGLLLLTAPLTAIEAHDELRGEQYFRPTRSCRRKSLG